MAKSAQEEANPDPAGGQAVRLRSPRVWLERLGDRGASGRTIFVASFLESTVVPIPIEIALVPLMVSRRDRLWWIATMASLGCLAGAGVGYIVGYLAFESVGRPLIDALGYTTALEQATAEIRRDGFWFVISIGIAPIPFQAATVGAGLVAYPIAGFVVAASLARATQIVSQHKRTAATMGMLIGVGIVVWVFVS